MSITAVKMNTIQIRNAVNPFQKNRMFYGVFSCDSLPRKITLPFLVIVNLSTKFELGTHWVSIYIDEIGVGFYFDSLGIKPTNTYILTFLGRNASRIFYNNKQIQHIASSKCGQFCCGFAINLLCGGSIHAFIEKFGNLFVNDLLIENVLSFFINKSK